MRFSSLGALQTMMSLKEKKEMDDAFKKAQKPWAKLYDKVNVHLFYNGQLIVS